MRLWKGIEGQKEVSYSLGWLADAMPFLFKTTPIVFDQNLILDILELVFTVGEIINEIITLLEDVSGGGKMQTLTIVH